MWFSFLNYANASKCTCVLFYLQFLDEFCAEQAVKAASIFLSQVHQAEEQTKMKCLLVRGECVELLGLF